MAIQRQILSPAETPVSNIIAAPNVPNTYSGLGEGIQQLGAAIGVTQKELKQKRERFAANALELKIIKETNRIGRFARQAINAGEVIDIEDLEERHNTLNSMVDDSGLSTEYKQNLYGTIESAKTSALILADRGNAIKMQENAKNDFFQSIDEVDSLEELSSISNNENAWQLLMDTGMTAEQINTEFVEKKKDLLYNIAYRNPQGFLSMTEEAKKLATGDEMYGGEEFEGISVNVINNMRDIAMRNTAVNRSIDMLQIERDVSMDILNSISTGYIEYDTTPLTTEFIDRDFEEAMRGDVEDTRVGNEYKNRIMLSLKNGNPEVLENATPSMLAEAGVPVDMYVRALGGRGLTQGEIVKMGKEYENLLNFLTAPKDEPNEFEKVTAFSELHAMSDDPSVDRNTINFLIASNLRYGYITDAQAVEFIRRHNEAQAKLTATTDSREAKNIEEMSSIAAEYKTGGIWDMFGDKIKEAGSLEALKALSAGKDGVALFLNSSSSFLSSIMFDALKVPIENTVEAERMGLKYETATDGTHFLIGKNATDYVYLKGFEGITGKHAVKVFIHRQVNQYSFKTINALRTTFDKYYTQHTENGKMDVMAFSKEVKDIIDGDTSEPISQTTQDVNRTTPQSNGNSGTGSNSNSLINSAIGLGMY